MGLVSTLLLLLFGVGCEQRAHDIKLPIDGRLTSAEVESLVGKLDGTDSADFRRWAERMIRGEQFGGEPIARTVREALVNQRTFEVQRAESAAIADARARALEKERADKVATEQRRRDEIFAHRQAVHTEIRKYIDATIPTYRPQTFYDRNDRPIGGVIEFNFKLANRAPKSVIGIAGLVTIKDVFGRDLGSYPFELEPMIKAGQTIYHKVTLNFDGRDERHHVLWRAQSITSEWFFESAAFEDGTRIDSNSVSRGSQYFVPSRVTGKSSTT